jgi:hypothetical protein
VLSDVADPWRERAVCAGAPESFHEVSEAEAERLIASYCSRCPVVDPCHEWADHDRPHLVAFVAGARRWLRADGRPDRTREEVR